MSDAAVATIVSGAITIVTLIIGFFTLLIKLKYAKESIGDKVDHNTKVTEDGTTMAASNAAEAATASKSVALTTDTINKKLNGGLHAAINSAIDPVHKALIAHTEKDANDLAEVKDDVAEVKEKFDSLVEYVHERNHDILGGMQALSNKMNLVAELVGRRLEESKAMEKPEEQAKPT